MEILTYWIFRVINSVPLAAWQGLCYGLCYGLWYYYCTKQEQDHKSKSSSQVQPKYSNTYLTDPRNRQLQAQLLEMLQGDVSTAKQLLLQQRRMFPGRHDNWYLEKVIYDLEEVSKPKQASPEHSQTTSQASASSVEPSLESRLFSMMAGDKAASYRLVEAARRQYPDSPERWYWEKVIQDLIRDRR